MAADRTEQKDIVDAPLVRRLLAGQFPQWADLPLEAVESAGTDNALFRLGDDKVVRVPRVDWAAEQPEKEQRWLPTLAPHLPVTVPVPLALGTPSDGYPWNWTICPWLPGENATIDRIGDPGRFATDLGRFVAALHRIDPTGGPPSGVEGSRGVPLAMREGSTREAIASLAGVVDAGAVIAAWDAALEVPSWESPPSWLHGDLQSGNLLVEGGRLTGVIDFGLLGVGDPAVDLIVAWSLLPAGTRAAFREVVEVDDATWARGRGWALSIGIMALAAYLRSNPVLAGISRTAIDEVLADQA